MNNQIFQSWMPCCALIFLLIGMFLFPVAGDMLNDYRNKQLEKEINELSSNYNAVTNEYETLYDKETMEEIMEDKNQGGFGG